MARHFGIITVCPAPSDTLCRVCEDGAACASSDRLRRGLCQRHYTWAVKNRRLETVGLPGAPRKYVFDLKPVDHREPGRCRLLVNGHACMLTAARRGLCDRHYAAIWQRPDLSIDDFALPLRTNAALTLNRSADRETCRVRENDVDCPSPAATRGLCRSHYSWLREYDPTAFEQLATPIQAAPQFTRRKRIRDGRCRVAENDIGCGAPAAIRGLCTRHYAAVKDDPLQLTALAAPSRAKIKRDLRPNLSAPPGVCTVIAEGVACTLPGERRGLCPAHDRLVRGITRLRIADFQRDTPIVLTLKPATLLNDGLCRAQHDGVPCPALPFTRGLCRPHYRLATARDQLTELACSAGTPRAAGKAAMPHVYLDKNVLFDWCDAHAFGAEGQQASVQLVDLVRRNTLWATISATAVTSSYNHIRHRARRPYDEGGRALDELAAETLGRTTVAALLIGPWRVLRLDPIQLRQVLITPSEHSFEDAMEWAGFEEARASQAAPKWFVTRDRDFSQGLPPWTVLEHVRNRY